jgi:hypothetical protein
MGDLYDSVDQMLDADPAELDGLKTLIQTSMQSSAGPVVTEEQWEAATNNRYLRLAQDNYEHFAPNTLFADAIASAANQRGDHRSAWEAHHRRAIQEAQKLALDPANANRSYVPELALTINAFGDHFLTDAFASGHLFNKEVMVAYFRASFFAGGSLTPAGEAFFQRVAEAAFVGDVREQFSALETVDYPVCLAGWCLRWHPNINSVDRFRGLLVEAAKQQPDRVANVAVLALHDRLNRDGLEVTNAAGDPAWTLTGDVHLNPPTLAIMQKAVRQSADNIVDPSIQASNLDFGPYLERVWRYVPQLTPASKQTVTDLVHEYTNPDSTVLSAAAAEIVQSKVASLIATLLREGKLKKA